jgi:UDP-N-acetylmuramate: L-alanyl-gamma-D-glutamyl-meso-diaminopimelate ligase
MIIHFIAIGGAAMHNLALAMHKAGHTVTGSDDFIYEPSKSRLEKAGLLPDQQGWFPEKLNQSIDAIILGMHATLDNPELKRAQELGLKIYSYPEFLFENTKNKTRVVVAGSHGKTTITSMIMHVLKKLNFKFDYLVGAQIEGFETMVELNEENKIAVFEGDEYLASPIDRRPKFHLYQPHFAVISGIAWDHINVFPTYEIYKQQFSMFIEMIPADGAIVYAMHDTELADVINSANFEGKKIDYSLPEYVIENGKTFIIKQNIKFPIEVFGKHNLSNIEAAKNICGLLGIDEEDFYHAITDFKGATRRLEKIFQNDETVVFKDFAHSPSKVKATVEAVKEQFSDYHVIACLELHTFSSLNDGFLNEYQYTLQLADTAMVYYNPITIQQKRLKAISELQVENAFQYNGLEVFTNSKELIEKLKSFSYKKTVLLIMTSGNFDGQDINTIPKMLNI